MDRDRFPMAPSQEPNPLRPYYTPSSMGTTHVPTSSQMPNSTSTTMPKPRASVSSSPRDFLPEIDLDLKSSTNEAWQNSRGLIDTLMWRYTSVLLAQPFDVAKTILQISQAPSSSAPSTPQQNRPSYSASRYGSSQSRRGIRNGDLRTSTHGSDSDDSDEMPDYFTSAEPSTHSPRRPRRNFSNRNLSPSPTPRPRHRPEPSHEAELKVPLKKADGILHAIAGLHHISGAVGLWRATNTTFLYSILVRTTDSFLRSLLLTLLGLPDIPGPDQAGLAPGLISTGGAGFSGLDLSDSPNPLGSLLVVGLASALTGLLLAPLDLVRTRLIATPISRGPRGLVQNLRRLPSLFAPATLALPTALYHSIPALFSAASPLFLRHSLRLSPELSPSLWSLAAFTTSLSELFLRLPLETVLRRAQMAEIRKADPSTPLIVEPAPYNGIAGTVYAILYQEGETTTKNHTNGLTRKTRGQGVAGLVRGWRIGFWGLVGVWGAGALGPGDVKARGQF